MVVQVSASGSAADGAAWPDLEALPGVADAVAGARTAIAGVRRLPANRRGWPQTAAAAGIRAARASAVLDGGSGAVTNATGDGDAATPGPAAPGPETLGPDSTTVVTDPILAGALRVSVAVGSLAATWHRAPLQALARLHTLAAADLVDADRLGRPRSGDGVTDRLALLADVVRSAPWSGPVLAAVVHGELLALRPFGSADGVVARAAARLTMIASGLDPQALTVPEVGFLREGSRYPLLAGRFATGRPDDVAAWIVLVCAALRVGAREARSIATAATGGITPELQHARDLGYFAG